jgi:hypothetical protein
LHFAFNNSKVLEMRGESNYLEHFVVVDVFQLCANQNRINAGLCG